MLRRLALSASFGLLVLAAAPVAAHAESLLPLPLDPSPIAAPDRLKVTVTEADSSLNGTYQLNCNPASGNHPKARQACERLAELEAERGYAFAESEQRKGRRAAQGKPGPGGERAAQAPMCTMQYGGPAKARITGTWHNHPVDVTYDRRDGCAISEWNEMVPVIPVIGGRGDDRPVDHTAGAHR
ncbi:hypothetical protein HUT18_17530 [Streptomyces sp. NA04227]|uniref:SSI family serine proteinase inhibitor n=1 Tax=Streptomyces sp. NA04227 TaxID=2742136 RepID=UPI0015901EC9|nr:SSI family serine proteinase inhibitor [Streptomyces sp. NA04227]QKW07923.1 hypothetical protein HUT18_17530 [Streptomyces sp. NA04227]